MIVSIFNGAVIAGKASTSAFSPSVWLKASQNAIYKSEQSWNLDNRAQI